MIIDPADILAARILIVDDQASNIVMFSQLLQQAGYTNVSSTLEPNEVIGLHHAHGYDLILLDLVMPEMDGFAVMEALKKRTRDHYLPVIVLTAEPGHKVQALQAGARDFISKPFDLLEVTTRIHNMLETRLLYRQLGFYNESLEGMVATRTAQLSASEARFRALTELASDWYWEQNETGEFTTVSGPVEEVMGLRMTALFGSQDTAAQTGWNDTERQALHAMIAARHPFHDVEFSRTTAEGGLQRFRVSGEPMFNDQCRFIGFRGIGAELKSRV